MVQVGSKWRCAVTCVTGLIFLFSVTSISGDTIGQIKLGLAPSIQTPRTFTRRIQPEKSISLQSNLAALQPEKLEQSNKNLHTQLKELDDLGNRFMTRVHSYPDKWVVHDAYKFIIIVTEIKVGCLFPMDIVSIVPHANFGLSGRLTSLYNYTFALALFSSLSHPYANFTLIRNL